MTPFVDLAPGTEDNRLAQRLAQTVRDNLEERAHKRRDFAALRGSVAVVANDVSQAVTLRFDHGRLTVHDGIVGIPDVTLRGDTDEILALATLPLSRRLGLPFARFSDKEGLSALRRAFSSMRSGRLKVYGLWQNLPLLVRMTRVLSQHG
jgi:hypothetical protein